MNEYCKRCLRHSWGSSPERKKLEQDYNRNYYAANKNRWVINRQRRLGNLPAEATRNTSLRGADEIIVAPATFYEPGDFSKSSEEAFKKAKKFVKDFWEAPAAIIEGAKAVGRVVAKVPKVVIESGKKFVNALKNTKLVKFMKEASDAYDKAVAEASAKKYDNPIGPKSKK